MTSMLRARDFYRTSDLALAAVIALSSPLEVVDQDDPYTVLFVFRRTDHLDALVEQFWRGELRVEPQAYGHQVRLLQTQAHALI